MIGLAFRNVVRQKIRTGMTLAAISFGVTALILAAGFIEDMFVQLGEAIIHSQTGHVQIFKSGFLEKGTRFPEQYLIDEPEKLAASIAEDRDVVTVSNRLYFAGLLNNGKRDLAVIGEGIEAAKEAQLGSYLSIVQGRQLAAEDTEGILIGQGVAQALAVKPGDKLTLVLNAAEGAMNTLDFTVTGVFQSFSKEFDARAIRIPLAAAQELLLTSGANQVVVLLHRTEDTERALGKISTRLAEQGFDVKSWRTLSDFYDKSVQLYKAQFGALQLIILLMVLLSVVNSVNMSVFERQAEFGTMRAIGDRSARVFKLIVLESTLVGLIGAVLGMALGCAMAALISWIGIEMPPPPNANLGYVASVRLSVTNVLLAGGIGFVATALASIFPAVRASRLDVVDALRQAV
ncbi:MAG: ABC transporter permease [Azonexus sp.]|nr:ABC transporter permease [Betaproteobacteria bacterium]MBK8918999.1 ABC transporter permease [Betaproteobacteria bacterium]MBP6035814.1 ABC transporter permease [Azonexus sp.]MBP6905451.1 ABC transporter permease [Azonexus sp.]